MITVIPRKLLARVVDEVFKGAIEDTSVIQDIYAIIKKAEADEQLSAAQRALYFCLTCQWYASDVDGCTYRAEEIFVDSTGTRFCAKCADEYRGGTKHMRKLSLILSRAEPHIGAGLPEKALAGGQR